MAQAQSPSMQAALQQVASELQLWGMLPPAHGEAQLFPALSQPLAHVPAWTEPPMQPASTASAEETQLYMIPFEQ
jgi:hypothetical protein